MHLEKTDGERFFRPPPAEAGREEIPIIEEEPTVEPKDEGEIDVKDIPF